MIRIERDLDQAAVVSARTPVRAPILRRAALQSARLLEAAGESTAAAEAYVGVVTAGDVMLVDVWHGLAANLARAGREAEAEWAFVRGLDASGRATDQIRIRYDLAGFYANQGRLLEALAVVEALTPHIPHSSTLAAAKVGLRSSIEIIGFDEGRAAQGPPRSIYTRCTGSTQPHLG